MQEKLYKKFFEAAPAPLIVTDPYGTIQFVNEQASHLLNHQPASLEGSSFSRMFATALPDGNPVEKSDFSFKDFLSVFKYQQDHWIKTGVGTTIHVALKQAPVHWNNEALFIWSLYPIGNTRKLSYELKERVKEQLAILNVTETCFQNQNIPKTLSLCLDPIREGWQFPQITEVRITLASGEVFATEGFQSTEWLLRAAIRTANEQYGYLEVCYRQPVIAEGGNVFLYEEERLISVLAKLLGTFLEHWYSNKRMDQAVVEAQEKERYQISMELHDSVQQLLTAASLNVDFLDHISLETAPKEVIRILKRSLAEATRELRRISQQLAPSVDPDFPLAEKIHFLAKSMSAHNRLSIATEVDPDIIINEKIQLGFYRIIQEQLTNIIKHARTSAVLIKIHADPKNLTLLIADKGVGFDKNLRKTGIGLGNIRRRVDYMNGSLDIFSAPGEGTRLVVQVPI